MDLGSGVLAVVVVDKKVDNPSQDPLQQHHLDNPGQDRLDSRDNYRAVDSS